MLTNISLLSNFPPHISFTLGMKVWNFCLTVKGGQVGNGSEQYIS